jgi:phosphoheptose isomerase
MKSIKQTLNEISGNDDSELRGICNITLSVTASRLDRILEMHIAIDQILCEMREEELC